MKKLILVSAFLVGILLLSACAGAGGSLAPNDVTFDISIIEIKGSTDKLDPPEVDPASLSKGYGYTGPGKFNSENPAQWQVSTYLFSPAALTAGRGDRITLRIFVVNGDTHIVHLEAPDGSRVQELVLNRGNEYSISFTPDQSGYYTLQCENHGPTMQAKILVLP